MELFRIEYRVIGSKPEDPTSSTFYGHKSDHRDRTRGKAQWEIPLEKERAVFSDAIACRWIEGKFAWGLYRPNGNVEYVGVDRDHRTKVFLTKFDRHENNAWHGYPCNNKEPQQRPPEGVLGDWLIRRMIAKAKLRKLAMGQRCAI